MPVRTQVYDDVVVISLRGKITIGLGDVELRNEVEDRLKEGFRKFVVAFADVTTIDSAGISEVPAVYSRVVNAGGDLALASVIPKVDDILTITQLKTVFDIYPTVQEAVDALKAESLGRSELTTS